MDCADVDEPLSLEGSFFVSKLEQEHAMTRSALWSLWAAIFAWPALFVGCSEKQHSEPTGTATAPPTAQSPASEASDSDQNQSKMNEALAKLSPEDRTLAEKQRTCPVSNEPLGSMGVPIKVTVEGRDAFVCCEGCVDELKNNFAKYAENLPQT